MGPRYDDRAPQEEPTREPLVDLNVKPARPGDPSAEPKPRRKRLSDMGPGGDEAPAPPQTDRQRRRSLTTRAPEPEKPPAETESSPEPRRPRLVNIAAAPGEQEPRLKAGRTRATITPPSEEPPAEAESSPEPRRRRLVDAAPASEEQEPRLKVGHARATITHSFEDTPGLQNIIDRPSESGSFPEAQRPRLVNTAAPEEKETRPNVGRPRATITQSAEDLPGLQNIVDPPRAVSAVLDLGQGRIQPTVPDRRAKQSLSTALMAAVAAAVVAAVVWALITMTTSYHAGWMTAGVGVLVGGAVRMMGRGGDRSFGYLGAAVSVVGCLLGNLLSVCAVVAAQENLSALSVLTYLCSKPAVIPAAMVATLQPLDLLFWGVGIYAGYRLSFRRTPRAETSSGDQGN
jgi:hypothetical protein